ncbi:transglycosylase SLT domain-containing protein, partial [Vibrio cholerae O1]|nr:transglycosylase SLT domain-containing protein [Vibrio cholerae O1]
MAKQMLEAMGWGDQWGDLNWLVNKESSWNPNAQNPTSTAYGLFQFLNGTWGTVGGQKTSDPRKQIEY